MLAPPRTKNAVTDNDNDARSRAALEFAHQAERLGLKRTKHHGGRLVASTDAIEAKFVTQMDPVIMVANGQRLPTVPIEEAKKLNRLRDIVDGKDPCKRKLVLGATRESKDGTMHGVLTPDSADGASIDGDSDSASLKHARPPTQTNPLFPPLPMYGPPTLLRDLQCYFFRATSAVLSLCFLLVIILGSAFTSIPLAIRHVWIQLHFKDPDARRPFYDLENERKQTRKKASDAWLRRGLDETEDRDNNSEYPPTEGGPDPLVCDVRYYARRVGLDIEEFSVQTEDGFIIELWHVYTPKDYIPASPEGLRHKSANVFGEGDSGPSESQYRDGDKKYPVLLMHGLLQSAGAYCCNDDESLAFYLAKAGYDVWLGNNRCGFKPKHCLLSYGDPRMWSWNIRQMGVLDLTALVSRVLLETGFEKLGLVCHSQGTTQTFVALAKEQRPDLGEKISVFCALAPAVYAGPLIRKMYFKFMRVISPAMFRVVFGIHAFIPFMMQMHKLLPGRLYGAMGYRVFSFLFDWTDDRWDQDLRARMFQFAPVYVSSESMRWWLGRECFARHKCILSTRDEAKLEDDEDDEEDELLQHSDKDEERSPSPERKDRGRYSWYDERMPPLALWVAGNDDLVDGARLLRRLDRGREPHVNVVHKKIIEGYEHLDVIWAMDAIEQVGREVKEVLWRTATVSARKVCRTPKGCEEVRPLDSDSRHVPRTVVEETEEPDDESSSGEDRG